MKSYRQTAGFGFSSIDWRSEVNAIQRWSNITAAIISAALLMSFGSGASAQANTALPGALWTMPMGLPGGTTVAPDGDVLVASCETSGDPSELVAQRLTLDGNPLWQLFRSQVFPGSCPGLVSDTEGNTYLQGFDSQQNNVALSVDRTGHIRWATSTGDASGGGNSPVLGANGSVFFEAFDGLGAFVLGFDTTSGTATYHQSLAGIAGLHAYQSGLAEISDDNGVAYYGYDGSLISVVDPTPAITNSEPSANGGGAAGTIFVAGYAADCHTSHLSVSKITPVGRAGTWTDASSTCGGPSIAATPDGGVVVSVATGQTDGSVRATSLSADGTLRWQQSIAGAERNSGNQVLVDANGVVALQTYYEYPDPDDPSTLHIGVKVQFLSAQTGNSVFPAISATDPSNQDFQMTLGGGVSIGSGRVYIPESGSAPINSVSAYSVPGLGQDYQSVLQASLTSSPGGGGSPPGAGDGAPPIVQSPPPTLPPTPTCPAYMVIDSRGSGENKTVHGHVIPEISPPAAYFISKLHHRHPSLSVSLVSNPYPAVGLGEHWREFLNLAGAGLGIGPLGAYHASVARGERWLRKEIQKTVNICGSRTHIILIGFSQGAQVTGDVYQRDVSSTEKTDILAVLLFGDPYFNPSDKKADRGAVLWPHSGVLGERPAFGGDHRVLSYCHVHDIVCQRSNVVEIAKYRLSQHRNYGTDAAAAASHY